MTSFNDPMQILNQRVLEKQSALLIQEIEATLAVNDQKAAFESLYFYLSQNYSADAAQSLMERYPSVAIIFSAKDSLLSFANRDKALICWQAFTEAARLVAENAFDEATSHLRRARTAFSEVVEFQQVHNAWSAAKAQQFRKALMCGDEETARKLEKEIDCKETIDKVQDEIDRLFAIDCRELELKHVNGDIQFNLGDEMAAKVSLLDSFETKVFFTVQYENSKSYSLVEYNSVTNHAFEYTINGIPGESIYKIKSIPGTNEEFLLEIENHKLIRVNLVGLNSKTTAICNLGELIIFDNDSNSDSEQYIENFVSLDRDNLILHYMSCDYDGLEKIFLFNIKNYKIIKHKTVEYWVNNGGIFFTNKSSKLAIFLGEYSDCIDCYDSNLNFSVKTIDEKYYYYQNIEINYRNSQIYIIGACRRAEDERDIFDLLILDFDLKIIKRYENIYPYQQNNFWLNYDFKYDTENGLIYFSEMESYYAYDYINKFFVCKTTIPIFFHGDKKAYRFEFDSDCNTILLKNMMDLIQLKKELLQDVERQKAFHKVLETTNLRFYEHYVDSVRQALKTDNLACLIANVSKDQHCLHWKIDGLHAIAEAVQQRYDRDL